MSTSTAEDEIVCIFGNHLREPNRSTLMTFNTRRKEELIAETNFRRHCAMACLEGANWFFFYEQLYWAFQFYERGIFFFSKISFTLWVAAAIPMMTAALPTKLWLSIWGRETLVKWRTPFTGQMLLQQRHLSTGLPCVVGKYANAVLTTVRCIRQNKTGAHATWESI